MRTRYVVFVAFSLILFVHPALSAMDMNDLAYESRIHLEAGTIWNPEGVGDCLLYPYFDVRKADGKTQVTRIDIENTGEYGIAAKLRFREWARGREIFSKDIWIPTKSTWTATVEMNGDGTNAIITGSGNVISKNDTQTFYFTNALMNGVPFSTRNIRRGLGDSTLCGFVEVIGEEKTAPDDQGGQAGRLAPSEQDCPNDLKGVLSITRVEDGAAMAYDAVAIGNFSRGQGSLFRTPGSPYPRLDNGEDSLDQLEFQLSKFEVFGPFSVTPSNQGKTSLIVTFPTKFFHYSAGRRIKKINNPFEARTETQGESLKTSLSQNGAPLPADSELTLPYSVNVIGLYKGSGAPPSGIDNLVLPVYSYDTGDAKLTSANMAQRILIQDFEYFKEMYTTYRGLPALGLVLREYRNPDVLHPSITPAQFSAVWEASSIESVTFPTFISGPSSGLVNTDYTYTTGGAASTIGHPIQYQFDWGDGSPVSDTTWLDVGVTSVKHKYAAGGAYAIFTRARCALHPNLVSKWSKAFVVVIESISPPAFLTGQVAGIPNTLYTYMTGGASTNVGNPVQYFFDWGDSTDSNWLPMGVTSAQKAWPTGGTYSVKARARDSVNPSIVSTDTTLTVNIELISTPSVPQGPNKGFPGDILTYMTGGASSNIGDSILYQIDWGDGSPISQAQPGTTFTKTWTTGGTFHVRARAQCAIHTSIVSAWSADLTVNIAYVTAPTTPTQAPGGALVAGEIATYSTGGSISNIGDPVQYWFEFSDGTSSGWLPVGVNHFDKAWLYGPATVRAKARDATYPSIVSDWSGLLQVDIESISAPNTPTGPSPVLVDESNAYSVSGAACSLGTLSNTTSIGETGPTRAGWLREQRVQTRPGLLPTPTRFGHKPVAPLISPLSRASQPR